MHTCRSDMENEMLAVRSAQPEPKPKLKCSVRWRFSKSNTGRPQCGQLRGDRNIFRVPALELSPFLSGEDWCIHCRHPPGCLRWMSWWWNGYRFKFWYLGRVISFGDWIEVQFHSVVHFCPKDSLSGKKARVLLKTGWYVGWIGEMFV